MKRLTLSSVWLFCLCAAPGAQDTLLPVAVISLSPRTGPAPLTVTFDGSRSYCQDRRNFYIIGYDWYVGEGTDTIHRNTFEHTYQTPGTYVVSLVAVQNAVDGSVLYQRGLPSYDTVMVTGGPSALRACRKNNRAGMTHVPSTFDVCGRRSGRERPGVRLVISAGRSRGVLVYKP